MRGAIFLMVLALVTVCLMGAGYPEVYFQMDDPVGDEYGYGNYQYPGNIAFQPYRGLFDITAFRVWREKVGEINFDTTFGRITNPWMAPEGFIHQNLRIFIDTQPNRGYSQLPKRGAYVSFEPRFAWDICLRVVGWGNSQILINEKGILKCRALKAEVLGDGRTIRAKVGEAIGGIPDKKWKYYVLVGSYDGFGEDFFRKVARQPGEWVIGGGCDQAGEPRVLDLLAPKNGPHSQEKQLRAFNLEKRKLAVLFPVGKTVGWSGFGISILKIALPLILLGGLGSLIYHKPRRISWFWVKQPSKNKAG